MTRVNVLQLLIKLIMLTNTHIMLTNLFNEKGGRPRTQQNELLILVIVI